MQCHTAFGAAPEKPYLAAFIPERFRTAELLYAVYGPIWRLERDVIWPDMARLLQEEGIRGDLVEFGVFGGNSFLRLIEIFRPLSVINRYYGFDGFRACRSRTSSWITPFSGTRAPSPTRRRRECFAI